MERGGRLHEALFSSHFPEGGIYIFKFFHLIMLRGLQKLRHQKVENILNLALDADQEEREKSMQLDVGYDPDNRTWELIVKYSGSLEEVRSLAESVTELVNEYAVIIIRRSD